jgi:hypothetical protein
MIVEYQASDHALPEFAGYSGDLAEHSFDNVRIVVKDFFHCPKATAT